MGAMIHTCAHTMNTYNTFKKKKKKKAGKTLQPNAPGKEADLGGPA